MKPALFAELCCGSAAVTLRLLGGPHAKPPVSYQGSKRGYSAAILDVLGLRAGQGADAVLLCDPGPWSSVWRVLSTPDGCREVARIIRGWAGEEPRALWERLRAEGPLSGKEGAAQYVTLTASNRLINADWRDGRWANTGKGGTTFGGEEFATPAGEVVEAVSALERIAWPAASTLVADAWGVRGRYRGPGCRTTPNAKDPNNSGSISLESIRDAVEGHGNGWPSTAILSASAASIDPREVAAWLWVQARSFNNKGPEHGFTPDVSSNGVPVWGAVSIEDLAGAVDPVIRWPDTALGSDARHAIPSNLPPGCVIYLDPPYENTTGYANDLPRAEVLEIARRWSDAGAIVCISEAEPMPLPGWHEVEITAERQGQKRTFSKQQREFLTLNRPPAVRFDRQSSMFAVGAVAPKAKTLGFSFPDLPEQPEPLPGQPGLFGEGE